MIEVYKEENQIEVCWGIYLEKIHDKNDCLQSRDSLLGRGQCSAILLLPSVHAGQAGGTIRWSAVPFSAVRPANWVKFCDLADVHGELRSGQAHSYVCPKPRFRLGERLWNLFPKALPKLWSSFLQLPPCAGMIA